MLVLTRRPEEVIVIGGTVIVKVLSISGGQVKLGIAAPPDVEVNRGEIEMSKRRGERPRRWSPDAHGAGSGD